MTEKIVLDTAISEPSMTAGEAEMLLFSLDRSRAQFAWKVGGLDAGALRRAHAPSTLTLGRLIKHIAFVEDFYVWQDVTGEFCEPWISADLRADPDWVWTSADDDSPEELYGLWRAATERSRAAWTAAIADRGLDAPSRRSYDGWTPNLRRVLLDLSDEYARHVGHADLLREAIDGLVGEDPPQ